MIRNWSKPVIDIQSNESQNPAMFDLIEVYVQEPDRNPNPDFMVKARPYEFEDDHAIKYATTSPHCGQGILFHIQEMTMKYGRCFIGCPTTGIGMGQVVPPYTDPFRNPVSEGLIALPGSTVITTPDKIRASDLDDDWRRMFNEDDPG